MNETTGTELSQRLQQRAKTGTNKWSKILRRRRMNDPLLVFNMAIFNVDDGWSRTLNPLKIRRKRHVTILMNKLGMTQASFFNEKGNHIAMLYRRSGQPCLLRF